MGQPVELERWKSLKQEWKVDVIDDGYEWIGQMGAD
jgi:hypothetical protein